MNGVANAASEPIIKYGKYTTLTITYKYASSLQIEIKKY